MTRTTAIGMAVMATLSGGLLVGCAGDAADPAASPTPPATAAGSDAIDGYWKAQGGASYACTSGESWDSTFLKLRADGRWTLPFCDTGGVYEVAGDTITWLGGDTCAADVKGIYTYTLANDQLTQTVTEDACAPRREAFDGVTFERMPDGETYSPTPAAG